jgi:hypothetical protein
MCWLVLFCAARSCSLRAQLRESCGREVSSAAREWGWGWRGWERAAGWSIVPPAPRRQRAVRSKERRSTSYGARHKAIAGQGHSQGSTRVKQPLRARVSTKNEEQEQEQSAAHSEASFHDSRLTGGGLLYEAPDEVRGPLARSSTPVATRASIVQPVSPDGRSLPCEGTSTIRGTLCDPGRDRCGHSRHREIDDPLQSSWYQWLCLKPREQGDIDSTRLDPARRSPRGRQSRAKEIKRNQYSLLPRRGTTRSLSCHSVQLPCTPRIPNPSPRPPFPGAWPSDGR